MNRLPQIFARLDSLNRGTLDPSNDFVWLAAVDEILAGLSADELAAIFSDHVSRRGEASTRLLQEIHFYWALQDPSAAFAFAGRKVPVASLLSVMRTSRDWPAEDPDAAMAWALANHANPALNKGADTVLVDALDRIAMADPSRAVEIYHGLDPDLARDTLMNWAERHGTDPAFRERIVGLAREDGRAETLTPVLSKLMSNWGYDHPEEAKAYLESSRAPASADADAGYVEGIQHRDPGSALDWWMSRHSDDARSAAGVDRAMMSWVGYKAEAALGWLGDAQPGPQRDALYAAAISQLAVDRKDDLALESLEKIGDPSLKEQARRTIRFLRSSGDPK